MAFCFILIHHYGHVASEEDENDNDEKEKDKLSYRLVMFDRSRFEYLLIKLDSDDDAVSVLSGDEYSTFCFS